MKGLFFEIIKGEGALNFVLIHNAGGSHKFFIHQIEVLKRWGNVILLDLPGHGSSKKISNNNIENQSNTIIDFIQHLNLKNICLIGLNNGANLALHIFYTNKRQINSLILIDPPLFMSEEFIEEISQFIEKLSDNNKEYEKFISSLVNDLFIGTTEQNRQIAFNAFMAADKETLQAMFRSLIDCNYDCQLKISAITCPALCIITDEHHCSYQKISEAAPNFYLGKTVGSKCWATLEVPNQINSMIERFLEIAIVP